MKIIIDPQEKIVEKHTKTMPYVPKKYAPKL